MRWDRLFADLQAQAAALDRAELEAEVADRTRAEHGGLLLVDRMRGALGHPVGLRLLGGARLTGRLTDVGVDWALLGGEPAPDTLVPLRAVTAISGLGAATAASVDRGPVYDKLDFRRSLRAVAGQRSPVRVLLADGGELTGTLDRVGSDYVELAEHAPGEPRRRGVVQAVQTLPLAAIAAVLRLR